MITCAMRSGRRRQRVCGEPAVILIGSAKVPYCQQCADIFWSRVNPKLRAKIETMDLAAQSAAPHEGDSK